MHNAKTILDETAQGYSFFPASDQAQLREAGRRGCPIVIYRLGTITGHSRSGAWNRDDFYCRLLITCIEMGQVPKSDDLIDMTPVDYVSESIVYLSGKTDSFGRTFHLQNSSPIPIDQFVSLLRDIGHPIKQISYKDWVKKLTEEISDSPNHIFYPFISYFQENNRPQSTGVSHHSLKFNCRNTVANLSCRGIICPSISGELLRTYFSYLNSGFTRNA